MIHCRATFYFDYISHHSLLNVSAGCILRKMGIPIDLIACVNANDVVARFLKLGDYSVDRDQPTKSTWATAMDIQVFYSIIHRKLV